MVGVWLRALGLVGLSQDDLSFPYLFVFKVGLSVSKSSWCMCTQI